MNAHAFPPDIPGTVHTLAEATVGATVQLRAALGFDARHGLRKVGLRAGDVVTCFGQQPEECTVRLEDGPSVRVPRWVARRVHVEPAESAALVPG